MNAQREITETYAVASAGRDEAFAWLLAWHGWCHAIDDHVDENRPPAEVVGLCAQGAVLFSSGFYRTHAEALGPLVAVIAAEYEASLTEQNDRIRDALRIAGNHMVLAVAYLCGGTRLVSTVSKRLWPLVAATQFAEKE